MRKALPLALGAVGLSLLSGVNGCGGRDVTTVPRLEITPIQVESVDVLVQKTSPPRVVVHVRGVLGDGCSSLHSVDQGRSGTTVTLTILRERPEDAVCIQVARLYDERTPLEGAFPPGRYLLRVNGVEKAFATE